MYEEDVGMKFAINDASNREYYKLIWDALGEMAQERLTSLFTDGFFLSSKKRPVRSIGIILSLELQLMLKITLPPKKDGITRCVYVEVKMFFLEQLEKSPSGKYHHFNSKMNS